MDGTIRGNIRSMGALRLNGLDGMLAGGWPGGWVPRVVDEEF